MSAPPRLYTVAWLAALWATTASAASFDCAKAKKPMEHAICGDTALSKLDQEMALSYQRALRALSPKGASALKASQLSWLRYVNQLCFLKPRPDPLDPPPGNACLEYQINSRIVSLGQAGLRIGALVFTRVDEYRIFPNAPGDDTGGNNGWVVQHATYPQIDGVVTAAAAEWNARQAQSLTRLIRPYASDESGSIDYDNGYTIACANDRLLSLETTRSDYPHGAAHGLYYNGTETILLKPDIRPLTAADLFATGSDWQAKLPTLFIQAQLSNKTAYTNESVERVIREAATDERRWLLMPQGLQINFSAYEAGSYAGTPGPITVSWSALKTLLNENGAPSCVVSSTRKR